MRQSFLLLTLCAPHALAQVVASAATQQAAVPAVQESIDVTSALQPMLLSGSDRAYVILDPGAALPLNNNLTDNLRTDAAVNLQSRAGNGVQADLSIRGTTFEQSLVLLNGFRINDPESGHLNLDIPLPFEAIARVDVLHGSGSTFFGSDAIGGAINLITDRPLRTSVTAKAGFGSYSSEEQHLQANYATSRFAEEFAGSRDTSDGFILDRGYHSNALSSESWLDLRPPSSGGMKAKDAWTTDLLFAGSDRPYGANQFYGAYDSWERTKGWFASIQQQLGARTLGQFAYRRHSDLFVLLNDNPLYYRNNHVDGAWEGALRRSDDVRSDLSISYGLEADGDSIQSTNLGRHARNEEAGYISLAYHPQGRFTATAGAREEGFSGGGSVFSPNVAAGVRIAPFLRLRAAVGHGFRLPTYTDLYYSDPATNGNPALKPESSWSYEGGLDWTPGGRYAVTVSGFHLQQKNSIDYSKYTLAAHWQATNVDNLNLTGAESSVRIRLPEAQSLQLRYTAIQAASPPAGLISEYAYNYAAQDANLLWTGEFCKQWIAQTEIGVIQRTGHTAYPLWDLSVARNSGRVKPYLRLTNLSNTGYEEIVGVRMQGRTVMGGLAYTWSSN